MSRIRAANPMSSLPFDKIDSHDGVSIHDDFIGAAGTADATDAAGVTFASQVAWNVSEVAGDSAANAALLASEALHQGILSLSTGATTPADGDHVALQLGSQDGDAADAGVLLDASGTYVAAVVRINDVDAQKVEVGLIGQAPSAINGGAADVISIVLDEEDTSGQFLCQVNGAGNDTEVAATLVPVVTDTQWFLLEVSADTSSATFRITSSENTQTIVVDGTDGVTMPIVDMRPVVQTEAIGAGEETLDVDAVHVRYLPRVQNVADQLG